MTAAATMTTCPTWAPPSEFATQLEELYGLACPPLWGPPRRPGFATFGGRVAAVLEQLGTPPMPHQRYILDVALEVDPATGRFAYRNVGLSIPRQQGKTQTLLGVMTHRIAAWKRQNVIYTAQNRNFARKRWEDEFLAALEGSPLRKRIRARKTNGNEAIIWVATRSLLGIMANTEKSGHGPPLDLGVMDESFAHEDDRVEQAMSPAMLTRLMAQLWWASAGGTEKSLWLNRKRQAGRELVELLWATGSHPATAYFEWFAPDGLRRDDPATWRRCMPALCVSEPPCRCDPAGRWRHTAFESTIRAELESMPAAEFDRAYLNRTRKATSPPDLNVPAAEWLLRADGGSRRADRVALSVDVTPSRDWSSIGLAGPRVDGRMHLELVDHRRDTDWVPARLAELKAKHKPVAIGLDVKGPAGSLLARLAELGIVEPAKADQPGRGDLAVPTVAEVAQACGDLADAIRQDQVRHIGQGQLDAAVAGARTRPLGDAWAWARRAAAVDISPLVAVSLARWAFIERAPLVRDDYDAVANVW